jgi:two-component system, NarL family, sensor kinase
MENENQIDISILIIIGTMGVFFLVLFIIFVVVLYQKRMLASKTELVNAEKEHQKQLLEAALDVAEIERQKIAVNLHDEVGFNLSILKLNFNKLDLNHADAEMRENILATSYALIENSMDVVRGIHNDIRPRTLMSLGLIAAIKELVREINTAGFSEAHLICKEVIEIKDKNSELQLHRLIKELLNNTLRHAKPAFIEINIENIENDLRVIILHNGMGITNDKIKVLAKNSKGLGLKSILTRKELLNAEIDFRIETTERAKVTLTWPLL